MLRGVPLRLQEHVREDQEGKECVMKCPWKLNVPSEYRADDECDPECAWLVERQEGRYTACAMAILASSCTEPMGFYPTNVVERGA